MRAYGPLSEDALLLLGKVDRHDVSVSGRVPRTGGGMVSNFFGRGGSHSRRSHRVG